MDRKKKESVFKVFIEPHYERVYGLMLVKTKDHILAKDLTQNAFEKAWDKLDQLQNYEAARNWLNKIALHELNAYMRAEHTLKRSGFITISDSLEEVLFIESEEEDLLEQMIIADSYKNAVRALDQVREEYRILLQLRLVREKSFVEMSGMLNMPVSTVRRRYIKGTGMLKDAYDKLEDGSRF